VTQKLHLFRVQGAGIEDDRRITRWYEIGAEPEFLTVEGVSWERVHTKQRDQKRAVKCIREKIVSVQLPKHWPFAKRHDEKGRCVFESETEAKEACKRATDAGEIVSWDN
jgi:hypothetical protein